MTAQSVLQDLLDKFGYVVVQYDEAVVAGEIFDTLNDSLGCPIAEKLVISGMATFEEARAQVEYLSTIPGIGITERQSLYYYKVIAE